MIDTNLINQVVADGHQLGEVVQTTHSQLQANWPAITAAAVIVARELKNFNLWLASVASFIITHGGAGLIIRKLVWNPEPRTPNPEPRTQTNA